MRTALRSQVKKKAIGSIGAGPRWGWDVRIPGVARGGLKDLLVDNPSIPSVS
jgi:hypothetical protein